MISQADELGFEIAGAADTSSSCAHEGVTAEQTMAGKTDKVALFYKGVTIEVDNVVLESQTLLTGHVSDFSNICSTQYEGLRLGQKLTFRAVHVHHLC